MNSNYFYIDKLTISAPFWIFIERMYREQPPVLYLLGFSNLFFLMIMMFFTDYITDYILICRSN